MALTALLLFVGLAILLAAGDMLVRGAAGLARIANIPPLIVGLTVVAFGTSAPELVVTIQAVSEGAAGIAVGNIVGSNIANILMVLGLPAILAPIALNIPKLERHAVALLLATALFCGLIYRSGSIGTFEAMLFSGGMVLYFAQMVSEARSGGSDMTAEVEELAPEKPRLTPTLLFLITGLVGLPIGATLLVDNGSSLAKMLGIRDEIIGLTVVAFGTSLPELATVLAAAMKKQSSVVAGSIIGSNIFNMLFVGAAAGFAGTSVFTDAALRIDLPMMIAATAIITGMIFIKKDITRLIGCGFIAIYTGYIIYLATAGLI
ncbi:MAG: calcium/sodium antiporter [Pseudomonadota bacterium]